MTTVTGPLPASHAVYPGPMTQVKTGELKGATSVTQFPDRKVSLVKIKAVASNTGNVYIGGSSVTVADGTTDQTTGWQLDAGEETEWIPIDNLNRLYYIADSNTDDLVYFALAQQGQ